MVSIHLTIFLDKKYWHDCWASQKKGEKQSQSHINLESILEQRLGCLKSYIYATKSKSSR